MQGAVYMGNSSQPTVMERVAAFIVDKRFIIFFVFLIGIVFSVFAQSWVEVNDDLTDYLAPDTETRMGLDLMESEFTTFGTAEVLVENITYSQAAKMAAELETLEGVKSVEFDETKEHYNSASALFSVTFEGEENDEISVKGLENVRQQLASYDLSVSSHVGNPLAEVIKKEMIAVDAVSFLVIFLVLLFTSRTFGEVPVLLITFGVAALLNMGTNYFMGEISFVTDSVAIVLQLALAIDYAIILCHRFTEEHETKPARESAIAALSKAIPEISASSLTTVSGLLALCFMEYLLGRDMGVVLIKAILLSMLSVFCLMPGLLVLFCPLIDKTHHKSFVPKVPFIGKFAYLTRWIMPFLFVAAVIFAYKTSNKAYYVYFNESFEPVYKHNELFNANKKIDELFGSTNQIAVIVPAGDYGREAKLIENLEELEYTVSVTGLANTEAMDGYMVTDSLNPRAFAELVDLDIEVARLLYTGYAMDKEEYGQVATNLDNYSVPLIDMFTYLCDQRDNYSIDLPKDTAEELDDLEVELDDGKKQLQSEDWSRIVLELDMPVESDESLAYLDVLHGTIARYYTTCYLVGDTVATKDLQSSFIRDNLMITILSILFVVIVLLFTFKSVGLPVLLILVIQGSIWCNFSRPFLLGEPLYFLTYLILSAIQMGANIDYAIVISSRYLELKQVMKPKEAMVETMNLAFPTLLTSGSILAIAGVIIAYMTSNETISSIGMYLGQGTAISLFLVMFVLPQILLLGDTIISKTSFTLPVTTETASSTGVIKVNGHVKGSIEGYIDAEIHGVVRGSLNAVVDMGSVEELVSAPVPDKTEEKKDEK